MAFAITSETIVLARLADDGAIAETEAALTSLMRLGLIVDWKRQLDASYCLTVDHNFIRELASSLRCTWARSTAIAVTRTQPRSRENWFEPGPDLSLSS